MDKNIMPEITEDKEKSVQKQGKGNKNNKKSIQRKDQGEQVKLDRRVG